MKQLANAAKTCFALLTPPTSGAIATLALNGPRSWELLSELFDPVGRESAHEFFEKIQRDQQPRRFWLGKLGEPGGGKDDVVLTLKKAAPIPSFEIHCHGGMQLVAMLQECFTSRGAIKLSWQEFLRHTGTDALTMAAQAALCKAVTPRTAAILLDQYHGAFGRSVTSIIDHLRNEQFEAAMTNLDELARWIPLGLHLTNPWRVAIAGVPNVGKSSLLNRLAGYERCIVSETPGTTRDAVTTRIAVDGWPVELIDTAGIHDYAEAVEKEGIDLALQMTLLSDVYLWVVAADAAPAWYSQAAPNRLVVINKIDLPPAWDADSVPDAVRVSAKTGEGLDELLAELAKRLAPDYPAAGTAFPFTIELADAVRTALQHCKMERLQNAVEVLEQLDPIQEQQ